MRQTRSITALKARWTACLQDVEAGAEIVVTRRGRAVAVLVPVQEWERRQAAPETWFRVLTARLGEDGEALHQAALAAFRERHRRPANRPLLPGEVAARTPHP